MRASISGWYHDLKPLIHCRVAPAGHFDNGQFRGHSLVALIDTGTTEAMITPQAAARIGLSASERRTVIGAHGATEVNVSRCDIILDLIHSDTGSPLAFTITDCIVSMGAPTGSFEFILGVGALKCFELHMPKEMAAFHLHYDY
jgi:Aspartyl protease